MVEGQPNSHREAAELDAGSTRKIFREMIKTEMEARPLTWQHRRELLAFAKHLDINNEEAMLLLRAVEFECDDQTTTTATPARHPNAEQSFVTTASEHPISLACATLLLATLLGIFLIVQLIA